MRPCRLSPAVFFALFASVAADALPPDAVPVMCAAICGPIVELSSMCSPKRSLGGLGGSRLDREEHHRQHMKRHGGGYVEEKENAKREFIIIVPAPTTFPPGLLDSPSPLPLSPTSALPLPPVSPFQSPSSSYIPPPASIQPVRASPTSPTTSNYLPPTTSREVPPPTPPTVSSAHPLTSSVVIMSGTTSSHHKSTLPTIIGSDGTDGGETGGWGVTEDAEEKCVCLNDSFNVAEIAGLCASCISMNADTQNNMQVIMSTCGFPSQQYSPDKDSLASNIWVKATRPTAVWAASAKMNDGPRLTRGASIGLILGTVGFTIGALMML